MRNDSIGILKYYSREKRISSVDSFYWRELFTLANIATLAFVFIDFAFMFTKWHSAYTADNFILFLITIGTAAILDLPMMIAGKAIKKMLCGYIDKKVGITVIASSVAAFVLAFGFSLWFSYTTKDLVFTSLSSNMEITGGDGMQTVTTDTTALVLSAALFSGILPLGTSLASLVVTLFTYDPKAEKLARIRRVKVLAEEHLRHIEQGIAEAETLGNRAKYLIAANNEAYNNFVAETYDQELIRKLAYRQALMENCSNDEINHIIENSDAVNASREFNDSPSTVLSDLILASTDSSKLGCDSFDTIADNHTVLQSA